MKRTALFSATFILLNLGACVLIDKQVGDDESAEETSDEETGSESPETGDGDGDGDGEPETGDGDGDGEPGDPCTEPTPAEDEDCDGVGLVCDNASDKHNPHQLNQDGDDFGDATDLCPLIPGDSNTADSDKDRVGNACDRCRYDFDHYNDLLMGQVADPRLWIRNIPNDTDFDRDGVGDVCDNCVVVANCHAYGPLNPAPHGAEADDGDTQNCQSDADQDGIGDACIDMDTMLPFNGPTAAGPVGFGANDDFDQDGIINFEDVCPRLSRDQLPCSEDIDCNAAANNSYTCADTPANDGTTYCNHSDIDQDGVGDLCDTCPYTPNPMQVTDVGMQIDDEDRDFIGAVCEANSACSIRSDARRTGFYEGSIDGQCCWTTYPGDDVLHDPNGVPLRVVCSDADEGAGICRKLPASVTATPGVVELPDGCEPGAILTLEDVGGDQDALMAKACLLPPDDQDFDGIGDGCDLCMFAFDPTNAPYVDDFGMLWPNVGAACAGDFDPEFVPGAWCEPG
jgi:hypothetical protein